MVRAERNPEAIRAALARGDFYSSTGVILAAIERTERALSIEVQSPGEHQITFIGTGGAVLASRRGPRAEVALPRAGYVRAEISDPHGRKAWVQPVIVP